MNETAILITSEPLDLQERDRVVKAVEAELAKMGKNVLSAQAQDFNSEWGGVTIYQP